MTGNDDLLRYGRAHRGGAVLAGTAAVAILSALFGGTHIALPSIGNGGITTGLPFRHELPLLSAVFLTATLGGAMSEHDEMGGAAMHRLRGAYCALLTLTACAFSFGTEALATGPAAGAVFVRSVLIWLGLALLSAKLLGQQLGWAIPLASALLLIWYPKTWWDWTANPPTELCSWAVAGTALGAGVVATAATPWRRRVIFRRSRIPSGHNRLVSAAQAWFRSG
ncbi:hypothetical protein [Streptomyces sp. ITFR-6]|uniref:hypothetical protein n=1 Tax=Streptomyces sp. ITFR-6 TaxID=3075197 RepID=UPI00288BDA61|nr:hypothetical protein [Streptomyces sp. ITFR-6]WNI30147.1 hypothetical protein RLT59_16105 [Streptomyces sp. ITFR-6]